MQILTSTLMNKDFGVARSWDAFRLTVVIENNPTGDIIFPYVNCNSIMSGSDDMTKLLTATSLPIGCWGGNTGRNTETFRVPAGEWVVSWWTAHETINPPDNFIVWLHRVEDQSSELIANFIGDSNDFTVMHEAGDYYLEIQTTQLYSVMVLATL